MRTDQKENTRYKYHDKRNLFCQEYCSFSKTILNKYDFLFCIKK